MSLLSYTVFNLLKNNNKIKTFRLSRTLWEGGIAIQEFGRKANSLDSSKGEKNWNSGEIIRSKE